MSTGTTPHTNATNRLDRLPIGRFHKVTLVAVAFAYFFEFADINTFATTAPQLVRLWGVTVDQVAYVTSLSFVGMFVGSIVAGRLADRWGRRATLIGTTIWFSIFSMASAFTWDIVSMGVCRVLTSAGLAAMTVVAVIYVNELYPAAVRGRYQAYAIVIGICGTPVTNLIASAVVPLSDWSWRLVYVWGALGIAFLFFSRRIVESPRWYESRGRYDEAEAALGRIEREIEREHGPLTTPAEAAPDATVPARKAPLRVLLQRRYLMPTVVLTVLWVTQTIGFFGYSSWAPTLLASEGFSVEKSIFYVALTTVGAPLGSLLAALVTDRFERKWLLVVFGLAIAVSGLLYGLTFDPLFIVAFGFLVNMLERGYTALAYAYSPELFDIRGRSLGTGVAYGVGRLSNAVGPLVIAALYTGSGYQSVFFFIAGSWTVGALVLAVFGPRTRPSARRRTAATTGGA
ncbi:major facilitator transporter [Pseudonocardia sp. EC080610-09]|uniref:MFS transporter n=1 Tax=unclassified Pseudonocardia TaxID=2619320 RepID=UPI0006CB32C1|nr:MULTISPECIES: MFS transporter [unclassified Pseudonocardia]ALE75094.1 major facilitator transporter [Pseudonocardia sp. EC080625-04]ALL74450.1 major facilitator transporter [Pseudonocardia sp. EC080610-09]ALL81471.1 major facilitator transporter [Pseudonocardia sp. EC080619-01]